jgi:hypothetical protein
MVAHERRYAGDRPTACINPIEALLKGNEQIASEFTFDSASPLARHVVFLRQIDQMPAIDTTDPPSRVLARSVRITQTRYHSSTEKRVKDLKSRPVS